jgi:ribosomal protein L11 methyltransferase
MKFIEVAARFSAPDIELAEELICDIFFSHHLKGVVCQVPVEEPDEGFGTNTLPPPEHYSITGFFPAVDASLAVVDTIKQQCSKLSSLNIAVDISTRKVDEKEWEDAWKDYFEVTPITDRIIVKPEWKPYTPADGELIIHLDPGMAFGTGTHPTTAMCIRLIETFLKKGHFFLDVGTGSGILMIAAALLGAHRLFGIDTDPAAVDIAKDNLIKNRIPADCFDLACTTLDRTPVKRYDTIAANIIAQVIVDIIPDLLLRMHDRTVAVLSGIIRERLPDVQKALNTYNLDIIQELCTGEWVALAVKKSTGD